MNSTVKPISKFDISFCEVFVMPDNLVKVVGKDNLEIDINMAKELKELLGSISEKKELLLLIHPGKDTIISKEVREFVAGDNQSESILAEAVVSNSLPKRIVINFILNFYKPKRAMKLFSTEEAAIRWLNGFKSKN